MVGHELLNRDEAVVSGEPGSVVAVLKQLLAAYVRQKAGTNTKSCMNTGNKVVLESRDRW